MGGCAEGLMKPRSVWIERADLAEAFRVEEPGQYRLHVRYREYSENIVLHVNGKELGADVNKTIGVESGLME